MNRLPAMRNCQRGFSLIEMMVVLVIAGITMSIAVPAVGDWVRIQRVRTASFDVYAALVFARSEAISRNAAAANRILVLPAGACDADSCSWAEGWSIRQGGVEIQGRDAFPAEMAIEGPLQVEFDRTGRAIIGGVTSVNLSSTKASVVRCVSLDSIGRPGTSSSKCAWVP